MTGRLGFVGAGLVAALALWPAEARATRLGLLDFAIGIETLPLTDRSGEGGTLFASFSTALEPAPAVFLGFGLGAGLTTSDRWPVPRTGNRFGPALRVELFARIAPEPDRGVMPLLGVSTQVVGGGPSGWLGLMLDAGISLPAGKEAPLRVIASFGVCGGSVPFPQAVLGLSVGQTF